MEEEFETPEEYLEWQREFNAWNLERILNEMDAQDQKEELESKDQ